MDKARSVGSIHEEYAFINAQRCTCGNEFERVAQSLHFDDKQVPYDRIQVRCRKCGTGAEFWFNCATFFGKMD